jgi:hypothetical protein
MMIDGVMIRNGIKWIIIKGRIFNYLLEFRILEMRLGFFVFLFYE